jgi:hypothetical protein
LLAAAHDARAVVIDFEDLGLAPGTYVNDLMPGGKFSSGGATFNNFYDATWDSWEGWAYSNKADLVDGSFMNQYSAYAKSSDGTNSFAVAYTAPYALPDARIELPQGFSPISIDVTNVTYAALTMRDGDGFGFSRKFGTPPPGNNAVLDDEWPDWFKLIITGLDASQQPVGAPIEFYLADYRNLNGTPDYIVDEWTQLDLSGLAGARYLVFTHEGSDVGEYGLNTPAYVAVDNLVLVPVPEPATLVLSLLGAACAVLLCRRASRTRS